MSRLLEGMNPEQARAVQTTQGPLLILAGAGSGKTRVLTRRIAYILETGGESKWPAKPWNILAVTFTNKAAAEMKERVAHLVGPDVAREVWVSTFHSTCVRILRREIEALGYKQDFAIWDDDDQTRLLKTILAELKLDPKRYPPNAYRSQIDRAKNAMKDLSNEKSGPDRLPEVFRLYEERMRKANALDFNDLVNKVVEIWEKRPDVLQRWQDRWRWVLVDEYQDTNAAQYKLIKLLSNTPERNLAVVGDDDQSIYRFRGADLRNILDFEKDFPEATVVRLERNYRSTPNILAAASGLIRHNSLRKDKTLWTEGDPGHPLVWRQPNDEMEEAGEVVREIRRLMAAGRQPGEFAVVYRTNAQSRPVEQALVDARIPHVLVGGRKFYERREIRDVLGYLKLLLNPADDMAFLRVINTPTRGVGEKALATIQEEAGRRGVPLLEAARHVALQGGRLGNTLAAFTMMMDRFGDMAKTLPPHELVLRVAEDTGYLPELRAEATDEAAGRIENVMELSRAVPDDERDADGNPLAPIDRLRAFLDRVSLSGQADELPDDGGAVTLLTAHLAKGLEYPVVFVVGLAEKCFPHARAELDEDIEEERRLAYVAITRAKERLYLSWPQRRRGMDGYWEPTLPSRFLREIPDSPFAPRARPASGATAPRPPTPPTRLGSASPSWRTAPPPVGAPPPRPFPMPASAGSRPGPRPAGAGTLPPARRPDGRTLVPDSMEAFQPGTDVFHPVLGTGTIARREGIPSNPRLTIHFRDHGPRTVFAASAGLEILLS